MNMTALTTKIVLLACGAILGVLPSESRLAAQTIKERIQPRAAWEEFAKLVEALVMPLRSRATYSIERLK